MTVYTYDNRLTLDSLASEPNMSDPQKWHTDPILKAADEMGLAVWYDAEHYGLLIGTEKRGPLNLDAPLWVKDSGEANNVVTMLKLTQALCGLEPGIDLNARLEILLESLERMVSAKSDKSAEPKDGANKKSSAKGKTTACRAKIEMRVVKATCGRKRKPELTPEQIMDVYREMQPQFADEGVEFEIDEERQSVRYFNPRSRRSAIYYRACANDLKKVRDNLRMLRKFHAKKAA